MNPISCRAQKRHGELYSFFEWTYNIGNEEKRREREREKKCRFLCYNQPVRVVADIRAQRYPDNRSQMRAARCGNTACSHPTRSPPLFLHLFGQQINLSRPVTQILMYSTMLPRRQLSLLLSSNCGGGDSRRRKKSTENEWNEWCYFF